MDVQWVRPAPWRRNLHESGEPERIRKHVEVMQAVAAVRYVPYAAPIPLFFQFALLRRALGLRKK